MLPFLFCAAGVTRTAHLICLLHGGGAGDLADFQDAVFRHSRRPRQLTASFVILRVGQQHPDVADGAAHNGLIDVVGEVVFVRLAEIRLHGVAQGVERAGDHLLHGAGQRVAGVEEREVRLRAPQRTLDLLFLMGNDCAGVHLAAAAHGPN